MSEEIDSFFLGYAKDMAENAGASLKHKSWRVTKDVYSNFNTFWDRFTDSELGMGNILDKDKKPPRDFTFFYKEERYSNEEKDAMIAGSAESNPHIFDGILKVSYGGWNSEGNVSLKYGLSEIRGENAFKLLSDFADIDENGSLGQFLRNINIRKAFYGY